MEDVRTPLGVKLLAGFFAFGAAMCLLTLILLIFPGSALDPLWRINPEAQRSFRELGKWSLLLMTTVGLACGLAAVGLVRRCPWGREIALVVLIVNLLGDTTNAFLRNDYRTLIGLPIGGAMVAYLFSDGVRRVFTR
jgi:hypothetical protein